MTETVSTLTVTQSYPELASLWHQKKNREHKLDDFTPGSSKKVWWQCSVDKRHEWEAPIKSQRTAKCPYCIGRKILAGVNDLATLNPALAQEWHPTKNSHLDINTLAPGADRKAWWVCSEGHEWETKIHHRNRGSGCPFCGHKRLLTGFNDLATLNPQLATEWHPVKNDGQTPSDVTSVSATKVWWQCAQGHEWETKIANRANGTGCPVCAGCTADTGKNDLATMNPLIVQQWHKTLNTIHPSSITPGSNYEAWWVCPRNSEHAWKAPVRRVVSGVSCPMCIPANNLLGNYPAIAAEWHPTLNSELTPEKVSKASGKSVWWKCSENHEWEATVANRTLGSSGCPVCSGREADKHYNSLAIVQPEIASQWHPTKNAPLTSFDVLPYSNRKVWWTCIQGHDWKASVSGRSSGLGCPVCSGRKTLLGFNDLRTVNPTIADQWHLTLNKNLTAEEVTNASNRKVWWQCKQGHEWKTTVATRTYGIGCPVCSGHKVLAGFNDLQTVSPIIAAQWHQSLNGELTAQKVSKASNKKVWWQCLIKPDHIWETFVYCRTLGKSGCPHCASTQFSSQGENDLKDLLEALGFKAIQNSRSVLANRQELDIYIPEQKFAIEFNGVYWHSETFKDATYHKAKHQACVDADITLYQVWEDDWKTQPEIVIRGIAHRLGVTDRLHKVLPDLPEHYTQTIGARQTKIITLTYTQASVFLDENHIQGSAVGTHYLGLVDSQERLRAVLILKRTGKTGELSIERYATAGVVPGGFTKLLKHAEKAYEPSRWVTFADLSLSDGGLYEKTGFTAEKILKPDYSYLVNGKRVHKFNYRLKRFLEDPNLLFEEGLTERELAVLNGLHRIWDSGKVRYTKIVNMVNSA